MKKLALLIFLSFYSYTQPFTKILWAYTPAALSSLLILNAPNAEIKWECKKLCGLCTVVGTIGLFVHAFNLVDYFDRIQKQNADKKKKQEKDNNIQELKALKTKLIDFEKRSKYTDPKRINDLKEGINILEQKLMVI